MVRSTNNDVIAEFRANHGVVDAPYPDPPPMLLLHTTGRRSGTDHITPMRCHEEGDAWHVFASAHGSDRDPDWLRNLIASPEATIELGTERIPVRATVLEGAERDRIFAIWSSRFPSLAEMQERLTRTIPVVRLVRR